MSYISMQICSPNLRHHAVAQFFTSIGTYTISRVTQVLDVIKADVGDTESVALVVTRCLPGARLREDVAGLNLRDFHQQVDAALAAERDSLQRSFVSAISRRGSLLSM